MLVYQRHINTCTPILGRLHSILPGMFQVDSMLGNIPIETLEKTEIY